MGLKIKRENKFSLFAPNLTMNLTYLCSGFVKVRLKPKFENNKTLNDTFFR